MTDELPFSGQARAYLERIEREAADRLPEASAQRVRQLVRVHEKLRRSCLNLLPAENTTSRAVLDLLGSEIATRLTEGFPGDKIFPPPRHNVHIEEIEAILIALVRQLFRCRWVEWRATSNTMANTMVLEAITRPGDTILVQAMESGGNRSYHRGAVPDLLRLEVESIPPAALYGVDVDAARELARSIRPKAIVVGGGYFLFPLPVRDLVSIARETGAVLVYDAAHVALHVACGDFQDPLGEGADVLTFGTHKVMSGPVGGVVCTNRDDVAARIINRAYPLFLQTRDQNKYAAAAHSLAEMAAFGADYARQLVANARALGAALEREGFPVLGRERSYTMTHQVVVDVGPVQSEQVERRCQASGILLHRGRLPGEPDHPDSHSALRISVQEPTRLGMRELEMAKVASLISRAAVRGEDPASVGKDVASLTAGFQRVCWSFDSP